MVRSFYSRNSFVYVFNLGLMFLIFDIAVDFFRSWVNINFLNEIPFSAIGFITCLLALPFLLVEWLKLPLGTHSKRISLYQGAGNLLALAVLVGNWVWREESLFQTNAPVNEAATLTLSSGGLLLAILFGWLGKQIAVFLSKKRIRTEQPNFLRARNTAISNAPTGDAEAKPTIQDLISNVSATPARQN